MAKMAIRYSLFPNHHLPLIAKIDSKSKQFRLMFRTEKIDSKFKQIYDSKNNIARRRRRARRRDRLWILPASGGWALGIVCATACPALDLPAGGGWALDLVCATARPALDLACRRLLGEGGRASGAATRRRDSKEGGTTGGGEEVGLRDGEEGGATGGGEEVDTA